MNCLLKRPDTDATEPAAIENLEIIDHGQETYGAKCPNCIDGFRKYTYAQDYHTGGDMERTGTCDLCEGTGEVDVEPENNYDFYGERHYVEAHGKTHWLPEELEMVLFFHNDGFRKMVHEQSIKHYWKQHFELGSTPQYVPTYL